MTLRRVFIANRGEIAVRVIRTCKTLGLTSILGASEADLNSTAARLADEVVRIGPARSSESYLHIEAVVGAALRAKADAIHPGYGFLSENVNFARAVRASGMIFVGPSDANLEAVGDKLRARGHAKDAGLPLAPGGSISTPDDARALAERIGFPLLVKAVGGGGGRGLKRVDEMSQLDATVDLAIAEANAAFGDPRVYLERFVASGRHVEAQVIGDGETVLDIGLRDCSVQRRYQKLIEEAPAPGLPATVEAKIRQAAVAFGRHLKYVGLGTVEFLYDRQTQDFYFLEMNARIQVEHPVTEAISGLDLVEEQFALAEHGKLRLTPSDIRLHGHAIECRLNAEDWTRDFRPSPGTVARARFPVGPGIRVDTHIETGASIPPFYDSLMAKIIVTGADRADAVAKLLQAMTAVEIDGVATNRDLHIALLTKSDFTQGAVDTAYLAQFLASRAEIL
jgi:acetyl-CoA carboxylase biotin carboxylase subunit